jgi:translocation and assembly module TamA
VPLLAQAPAPVKVKIEGVSSTLEQNIRLELPLGRAEAGKEKLPPPRIRQMFRSSDNAIDLALQPFGFYRPVIRKTLTQDGQRWLATYDIKPGPPVIVHSVDVHITGEGASTPGFAKARADFPLHVGDTLQHLPYESAKLALLTLASDSGYLSAKFDTSVIRVDREADTAGVLIRFDTGPRYRFGRVVFRQDVLDTSFLATRIPFKRGTPYRRDKLLEFQNNLAADPYFSVVEVVPHPERADGLEVPVIVTLTPQRPQAYEAGVGYATDNGPRVRGFARLRRINRRGHHAEADLDVSTVQQSASARYVIPAVLNPMGSLTFLAGYALLNPLTSSSHATVVETRLSRQRFGWNETASLGFHRESFVVGADTGVARALLGGLSYDRTRSNNAVFPTRGYRARFGVEGSAKPLATTSFLRLDAGIKWVRGIGPRTRVLLRGDAGDVLGGDFHALPPSIRFFTGGDQSVRGYRFATLAPRDSAGNVVGGRVYVATSVETDYRFLERWAFAGFTDIGDATSAFTLHLRQAVGVGLRWISPIGLLRVDVAYTLNPPAYLTDKRFRLHLIVGPDL